MRRRRGGLVPVGGLALVVVLLWLRAEGPGGRAQEEGLSGEAELGGQA